MAVSDTIAQKIFEYERARRQLDARRNLENFGITPITSNISMDTSSSQGITLTNTSDSFFYVQPQNPIPPQPFVESAPSTATLPADVNIADLLNAVTPLPTTPVLEEPIVNRIFRHNLVENIWANHNSLYDGLGNYSNNNRNQIQRLYSTIVFPIENLFLNKDNDEKIIITLGNAYGKFVVDEDYLNIIKRPFFRGRVLTLQRIVEIIRYLELPCEFPYENNHFVFGKGIVLRKMNNEKYIPLLLTTYSEKTKDFTIYVTYELREYTSLFNSIFKGYISLHEGTVIFSNTRINDIFVKLNIPKFKTIVDKKKFIQNKLSQAILNG